MAALGEVGERELVDRIRGIVRPRSGRTALGPGDDAAVVRCGGDTVVSTDVLTAGRHFPKGMTFEQFGWTAAAVSFSDIASMGARPVGFLPAVTAPEGTEEMELYDLMSGIDQCCEFCEADVLGGDTKFGPLAVAGTAIGDMEGRKPMTRSGARPGDILAVTGELGKAAAGFLAVENGYPEYDDSIFSLMTPVPRWEEGIGLASSGIVTSCMDLSDGLGNACRTVCSASHVGMEIEWEFLPIGEEVEEVCGLCRKDMKETVVRWGGEYELLFSFDRAGIQKLYDAGVMFSIIGAVTDGTVPYLCDGEQRSEMQDGLY